MASSLQRRRINFPIFQRLALNDFDLYSRRPNVEVNIDKNVFCLIGANGLGKSTFLNTFNYGVTGAIPDPSRAFSSIKDYYTNAIRIERRNDYFTGRISETSRDTATVSVVLTWPECSIEITREIFGSPGVLRMTVDNGNQDLEVFETGRKYDPESIAAEYQKRLLVQTGLSDFAQFVFLMHFVMTFDEGRHLIMWDSTALTSTLYLAFGTESSAAEEADRLRRSMERASSRGRNTRFAARGVTNRIEELIKIVDEDVSSSEGTSEQELRARHDELLKNSEDARIRLQRKKSELRDTDLKWTEWSANLSELQIEYKQVFSSRLASTSAAAHHPLTRATISEDICAVCGISGAADRIRVSLDKGECPFCSAELEPLVKDQEDSIDTLKKLDVEMASLRDRISEILAARERVEAELLAADGALSAAKNQLGTFEEAEAPSLTRKNAGSNLDLVREEIAKLEREKQTLISQSQEHYKKRDRLRNKLRGHEKKLQEQYGDAQEEFVPTFRKLAQSFIGLPIDIELEYRRGKNEAGFRMQLQISEQLRQSPDEMSESQRFFLDIALRMALSAYMAPAATLLIDTPEGSLDIAYEARAGHMFATFIDDGSRIVMTANLKSSQLVLRLAEECGKAKMGIERMTDWTELSSVQTAEEALFKQAYDEIESHLN